jgi:hypothetical protein
MLQIDYIEEKNGLPGPFQLRLSLINEKSITHCSYTSVFL